MKLDSFQLQIPEFMLDSPPNATVSGYHQPVEVATGPLEAQKSSHLVLSSNDGGDNIGPAAKSSRAGEQHLVPHGHGTVRAGVPARLSQRQRAEGVSALNSLPGAHPFRLSCGCSWCFLQARLSADQRRSRKQGRAKP